MNVAVKEKCNIWRSTYHLVSELTESNLIALKYLIDKTFTDNGLILAKSKETVKIIRLQQIGQELGLKANK